MSAEISYGTSISNSAESRDVLGFWLYIMTDCILFASLFAVFVVLHHPGAYGPSMKPLINLKYVLGETLFLLASNFTFGLAIIASYKNMRNMVVFCLGLTFLFGLAFVLMEVYEFYEFSHLGFSWTTSGASASFYALVGTHGLHVLFGLIWIVVLMVQFFYFGMNNMMQKRMTYLGMFWNFLDIVWIFLFTIVYLMGAM